MTQECPRRTSGGKANLGKFVERDERIYAAGLPTAQESQTVAETFNQYLLKDEVDAILSDAIFPPPKPRPLAPLRKPIPKDSRHAGPFTHVAELINPPLKTKFQTIVSELRDTPYASYWKKAVGQVPDPTPMFPPGFDIKGTTFGKKLVSDGELYDLVMPKNPKFDQTNPSKAAGLQTCRNYCQPPFNPNHTYGERKFTDQRGVLMKCSLTDDRVILGTSNRTIMNYVKADADKANKTSIGSSAAPYDNINCVPDGYSFGKLKRPDNLPECLTTFKINPERDFIRKCLGHLNSLRKILSKKFLPTFFRKFNLDLLYYDKEKSGWLPKQLIYDYCASKLIRFDPSFIEPLLKIWGAYNGDHCILYKTFVHILNFKEKVPDLPKMPEFPPGCLDFSTTYRDMTNLEQEVDSRPTAGVPSGRYFDLDYPITPDGLCRAHRINLPHETDMFSVLRPNVLTNMFVSHRDMYAKREPHVVRRVFEATGEKFTDERFNAIWEEAKKHHSQGWVCYETFRRAMEKYPEEKFDNEK